jgi:biopolymer transport protein ExbD
MPKIKVPKSAPSLDMTPMVDLAFLLVTFFMLTAKFRNMEPVEAEPPSATSEIQLPEKVMLVTVDKEGRVFFDISGKKIREYTLGHLMQRYPSMQLTQTQIDNFVNMGTFGQSVANLPKYLTADNDMKEQMDKLTKGIPTDSLDNQLSAWILDGYQGFLDDANEQGLTTDDLKDKKNGLSYAIKADAETEYAKVKKVVDTFRDNSIYQFNMVTNLKGSEAPDAKVNGDQ